MTPRESLEEKLVQLRQAFDSTFASLPAPSVDSDEDFLAVRVGGDPYALRSVDIKGIVPSRKVVPLPSRRPELLGLVGHRGSLVSVYSLAALLGYIIESTGTPWLALVGSSDPIGLGFQEFEAFLRVRSADIHHAEEPTGDRHNQREVVRVGNLSRPIIDIRSMLGALDSRAGTAGPGKES
jgi:chemotaxis signal transduction protein